VLALKLWVRVRFVVGVKVRLQTLMVRVAWVQKGLGTKFLKKNPRKDAKIYRGKSIISKVTLIFSSPGPTVRFRPR